MTQTKKRVYWVDNLRAFSILAVILGHIATPLTAFIFSWHMPLFFFVSGFFLKPSQDIITAATKYARRLLIPFVIFAAIGLIAELLKRQFFPDYSFINASINWLEEVIGTYFWVDIAAMHHYGFVLWFLVALFWGKIIAEFLIRSLKQPLAVLLIGLAVFLVVAQYQPQLPFGLTAALLALVWITLGYYGYRLLEAKPVEAQHRLIAIMLPAALLAVLPIPLQNIAFNTFSNPLSALFYSAVIIVLLVALFQGFAGRTSRLLAWWSSNTMVLFVLHPYTNNAGFIISQKYFQGSWPVTLLVSIFLLCIIILVKDYAWKKIRNTRIANYLQPA